MAIAIVLLCSFNKVSAADLGLIIWVEDRHAMDAQDYDIAMSHLKKLYPQGIFHTIYVSKNNVNKVSSMLPTHFQEGQKISSLVIATHGSTDKRKNQTNLDGLGGFNSEGSFGEFHTILSVLNKRGLLSDQLHIFLNSCSTLCGSDEDIAIRSQGLYKELSKYGVKKFSIWGARQPLTGEKFRQDSYFQFMIRANKKMMPLFGAAFIPGAAFISLWLVTHGFDTASVAEVSKMYFPAMGLLFAYANLFQSVSYWMSGKSGYLIKINSNDLEIKTINVDDPQSLGRSCESLFR